MHSFNQTLLFDVFLSISIQYYLFSNRFPLCNFLLEFAYRDKAWKHRYSNINKRIKIYIIHSFFSTYLTKFHDFGWSNILNKFFFCLIRNILRKSISILSRENYCFTLWNDVQFASIANYENRIELYYFYSSYFFSIYFFIYFLCAKKYNIKLFLVL